MMKLIDEFKPIVWVITACLVKFGKQPVDLKLQGFYNVEKPKNANDWRLQFQVKLLFPKKAK